MGWVWLEDQKRGLEVPDELVESGTLYLPAFNGGSRISAFFGSYDDMPLPTPPVLYRRAYPRRYEFVVAEDVWVKAGEPLAGGTSVPYVEAVVFERVG